MNTPFEELTDEQQNALGLFEANVRRAMETLATEHGLQITKLAIERDLIQFGNPGPRFAVWRTETLDVESWPALFV